MKPLNTFLTMIMISSLSSPSLSETLTIDELTKKNDAHYRKFTNIPFTGNISGNQNRKIKNGRREETWLSFYDKSQLRTEGNYKDRKQEGTWQKYDYEGKVLKTETFKGGELVE